MFPSEKRVASQEFSLLSRNIKFHNPAVKNVSLVPILGQKYAPPSAFTIHFNIILQFTPLSFNQSFTFRFQTKTLSIVRFSPPPMRAKSYHFCSPSLNHLDKILSDEYDTGRFIMFSIITYIYNKKTKGPTLMEFFHSHRKTDFFFFLLTTRDVRCVHHG